MPRPRERLLQFEGLADFLHFLDWACGLADTRERLAELAYATSRRLAASGAGYADVIFNPCLLYTSPSPRDRTRYRMPSSA